MADRDKPVGMKDVSKDPKNRIDREVPEPTE